MKWWQHYGKEVQRVFSGTLATAVRVIGARQHKVPRYPNSGCGAVSMAASLGATRIILVGYDCQKTGGQAHHHGDHPKTLGNAGSLDKWPPMFRALANDMRAAGVTVINASRSTALKVFERDSLERVLDHD